MTLLDRFRTPSRETHSDPAVRLAYVNEMSIDAREALAAFAREDEDARVRRAAVAKLMDPSTLALVARGDADEQVRAAANAMLRDIALEAFEGIGEPDSLAAVAALADARTLAAIAKSAPREAVALDAVGRVNDVHLLGSIARHGAHPAVRLQAFETLEDRSEILSVAMNGDFKDTVVAAVERFTDRGELEQIAARTKSKHASKRARGLLREMDERTVQAAAAAAQAAELEAAAADEMARAAAERAAQDIARAREDEAVRARAEAEEASRQRGEADTAAQAARQAAEREAASEATRRDHERRHARLAELAEEAVRAAQAEDIAAGRQQFAIVRREWRDVAAGLTVDADLAARYAGAEETFTARDAATRAADEKARRDALVRVQQLAARLESLAAKSDLTLKAAERALRDVRAALGQLPPLPSKQEYDEVMRRLKAVQSSLAPKVLELREITDWQRWANVGIQEQLCEKMEALTAVEDPEEVGRQIRHLQQQWREAADVPRAQGAALWHRFKTAHDAAWTRCEAHFAAQAAVRADNLAKKAALCERAESLADSTAWIQTADELKRLQAEWKTIGAVSRGQEKAIWDRFRTACDRFFTRRHTDLAERKTVWAANLAKKEALCVKAEALQGSTDWENAAREIRQLQTDWKTTGPVKKSRSEAIWQRFRVACDAFFTRYAQRHDIARGERVAAREAIVAELEQMASGAAAGPDAPATDPAAPVNAEASPVAEPAVVLAAIRDIRRRWQAELAARGVDRERAVALGERFDTAYARVLARHAAVVAGTDLDPDANRQRMEALVKRMEDLARSLAGGAPNEEATLSPTTRLAAMLKEALAANTIGGKVDEESRWRAAAEDVRQAQAGWTRIGPVPEETRRPLADRFARACRVITDKAGGAGRTGKPRGSGAAGRVDR